MKPKPTEIFSLKDVAASQIAQAIARQYATTGDFVRVEAADADRWAEACELYVPRQNRILGPPQPAVTSLVAVPAAWFALQHGVTLRTVQLWRERKLPLPILEDGFVPFEIGAIWVEVHQEHVRERRSWGRRPEGVSWEG